MRKSNSLKKIKEWLFFVDEDLKLARVSLREKIYYGVCFHAQQAVEKALKSLILQKTAKAPPRIHLILRLADLAKEEDLFKNYQEALKFLDQFYIPARYPDALPGSLPEGLPNQKDAENSLKYAEQIVAFVKNKLLTI